MDTLTHKFVVFAFLLLASVPVMVQADTTDKGFSLETVQSDDGFLTRQPTISTRQLQDSMADTERYLVGKTSSLEKSVKNHRKHGNNLVLAAVMPGGLLYLAYHKGQQKVAENELESVQQAQVELQEDVSRLQLDKPVTIQVAKFP
jgi:hypothetical protein